MKAMNHVVKSTCLLVLILLPLSCNSAENLCGTKLNEFGITIRDDISDSGDVNRRVIEFIFDANYQKEEQRHSSAFIRYEKEPNLYIKTALFVGKHQTLGPSNEHIYSVFVDKNMLPFMTLEITYLIDSIYPNNYLNMFVTGFENMDSLMCRRIKHN